ncbi:MAG TPA: Hsp20 family protein [Candidatus Angelobacter sp.]|nr:Hsp20 family protein [Candidatus Angelobacter sp.]
MQQSVESPNSVTITAHPAADNNLFEQESAWHNKVAERAFAYFQDRGSIDGYDWADWAAAESEFLKPIVLEVSESPDRYIVSAEAPGFRAKDLEIQLDGTRMLIHGIRAADESKNDGSTSSELASRPIYRFIDFSAPIMAEGCHAEVEDGILTLTLAKSGEQHDAPAGSD